MLLLPLGIQSKIDFDADTSSVATVVAKLAEQTHTKLKAAPAVGAEIVFVHTRGVSLDDLKAKLAEAIYGSWKQDGDTLILTRQANDERAIWAKHVSLRRKYLDSELERIRSEVATPFDGPTLVNGLKSLDKSDPTDRQAARKRYEQQTALFAKGPAMRLLDRLLLACNPDDLAGVGPYSRSVFRLNPTAMQKGFDSNKYRQALADFAKEQTDWKEAAAAVDFGIDRNSSTVSDPRIQLNLGNLNQAGTCLEVRRGDMATLFNVNLLGEPRPFGRPVLCQSFLADPSRKFLDAMVTQNPVAKEDPDLVLSANAKDFQRMFRAAFQGAASEPLNENSMQLLLRPDVFDPLGFGTNEVLTAYAEEKSTNVVAAIPDEVLGALWSTAENWALKLNRSLNAILQSGSVELSQQGRWAVFHHADPYETRTTFTPRAPMATFLKSLIGGGRLDLHDYARFAFESGRTARMGLSEYYMALYDRSVFGALDHTDWNGLSLYGSFDLAQQKSLDSGGRIPIGSLSAAQSAIIRRIVYAGEIRSENQQGDGGAIMTNAVVEPTETFATGLPFGGVVTAKTKLTPTLVAYGKSSDGKVKPLRTINPWTLAVVENDVMGDPAKMKDFGVAGLVGYAPGADKLVALRVELMPKVWKEMALTMPEYDPAATPVRWEQLPDSWAKQVREAIEQSKAQKNNVPKKTIPPR